MFESEIDRHIRIVEGVVEASKKAPGKTDFIRYMIIR
jgi:hypothetical protein